VLEVNRILGGNAMEDPIGRSTALGLRSGGDDQDGQCLPHLIQWVFALSDVIASSEDGEQKSEGYLLARSAALRQAMDIANVVQKYFIVSKG